MFFSNEDIKNVVLDNLIDDTELLTVYKKKLEHYEYIDELDELNMGKYYRWIFTKQKDDDMELSRGGILIDVNFSHGDPILLFKLNNVYMKYTFGNIILFKKKS
jgi:hypothetical protein